MEIYKFHTDYDGVGKNRMSSMGYDIGENVPQAGQLWTITQTHGSSIKVFRIEIKLSPDDEFVTVQYEKDPSITRRMSRSELNRYATHVTK